MTPLSPDVARRLERVATRLAARTFGGRWTVAAPPALDVTLLRAASSERVAA